MEPRLVLLDLVAILIQHNLPKVHMSLSLHCQKLFTRQDQVSIRWASRGVKCGYQADSSTRFSPDTIVGTRMFILTTTLLCHGG